MSRDLSESEQFELHELTSKISNLRRIKKHILAGTDFTTSPGSDILEDFQKTSEELEALVRELFKKSLKS